MLFGAIVVVCCGCSSSLFQVPTNVITSKLTQFSKKDAAAESAKQPSALEDFETNIETSMLGDYISVQGNTLVPLRGVGLVMGLNGTGGNPPPSYLRKKLLAEMARRDVPGAAAVLARRDTALVVVTAYLPANVRKGQQFDTRIRLPPNSNATSLAGGYLLTTRLFEETEIRGAGIRKGHEFAVAKGPILTAFGAGTSGTGSKGLLTQGSIPGGARSLDSRNLEIVIRKKYQSIRKSKQIADAIATRFHHFDRFNHRVSIAEAKTNALIELRLHPTYRNNFQRYQQVIRHIPLAEDVVARRLRMESLADQLLDPATSEKAAVQLEAIGNDAKPFLRAGLESPWSDVRFFSAESLAYMDDPAGVDVLSQAAEHEPAFRVYADAALANISSAQSLLALRSILNADSLEARYGALRAISEINDADRSLNTIKYDDRFTLRQIDSTGSPAVHLTRRRVPEVAIFGINQELQLPAVLNGGHRIRVIGRDGEDTVQVIRYRVGKDPVRKQCSRKMTEIVQAAGTLGAYYSDIVQLMIEAERQHNLEGVLGIDRLPQAGRNYTSRSDHDPESGTRRKVGTSARIPGIFDRNDTDEDAARNEADEMTAIKPDQKEIESETTDTATTGSDVKTVQAVSATVKSAFSPQDSENGTAADASPPTSMSADMSVMNEFEDTQLESPTEGSSEQREPGLFRKFLKDPFGQHSF